MVIIVTHRNGGDRNVSRRGSIRSGHGRPADGRACLGPAKSCCAHRMHKYSRSSRRPRVYLHEVITRAVTPGEVVASAAAGLVIVGYIEAVQVVLVRAVPLQKVVTRVVFVREMFVRAVAGFEMFLGVVIMQEVVASTN